jgi:citrate lyase subunit beta / citryl-CoA lyase
MMEKAAASAADQVFLDLEDACAPSQKKSSRTLAVEALLTHDFSAKIRVVRVNDVTTRWCHGDVVEVVSGAGSELDAIMLPKVEDASHVHFIDHLLTGLELDLGLGRRIGLELQIESPQGVVNLREISRASTRTETIIFGPGDYSASLGIAQLDIGMVDARYPGHQLHWVMSEVANHARAARLHAIDGPYVDFTDGDSYKDAATRAKLLGFDGKWCIHPNQVPWANEAFTPSAAEIAAAESIVAAYRQAADEGLGALAVDGKLVDEATRKIAESILERAGELVRPTDP